MSRENQIPLAHQAVSGASLEKTAFSFCLSEVWGWWGKRVLPSWLMADRPRALLCHHLSLSVGCLGELEGTGSLFIQLIFLSNFNNCLNASWSGSTESLGARPASTTCPVGGAQGRCQGRCPGGGSQGKVPMEGTSNKVWRRSPSLTRRSPCTLHQSQRSWSCGMMDLQS